MIAQEPLLGPRTRSGTIISAGDAPAKISKKGLLFFCVPAAKRARREHVSSRNNQRDDGWHCLVAGYDGRGRAGESGAERGRAARRMSAWVN